MGDSFADPNPKIRAGQIACKQTRKLKILKTLHKLIHACRCENSTCEVAQCEEMKTSVIHFKICTSKNRRECRNCRQLLALCRYHAKTSKDCESVQCVVPFCAHIKCALKAKGQKKMQQPLPLPTIQEQDQATPSTSAAAQGHMSIGLPDGSLDENVYELRRLLHANDCLNNDINRVTSWPCFEQGCALRKNLLQHVFSCMLYFCTNASCKKSKKLLFHWQNCRTVDCPLCAPVRHTVGNTGAPIPQMQPVLEYGVPHSDSHIPSSDWRNFMTRDARDCIIGSATKAILSPFPFLVSKRNRIQDLVKSCEQRLFYNATSLQQHKRSMDRLIRGCCDFFQKVYEHRGQRLS